MARLTVPERAALPDRAFAYIDSAGRRRLPIHDASHIRNALARFDRVRFESDEAKDRARQRLLAAAKKHAIMPIGFVASQVRRARIGPTLPSGAVTFLLIDMEGSTALVQQLQDHYADLLHDVRELVANIVRSNAGVRVDAYGDEYFAVFEQAGSAMTAAVAIQRAMAARAWPDGLQVRVRAGVHGGRPKLTESGYVGLAVHTVARIASVAHGGQVVVSAHTAAALGMSLEGVRLVSLGSHRLVGFSGEEELFQAYADGLVKDFPALRVLRS